MRISRRHRGMTMTALLGCPSSRAHLALVAFVALVAFNLLQLPGVECKPTEEPGTTVSSGISDEEVAAAAAVVSGELDSRSDLSSGPAREGPSLDSSQPEGNSRKGSLPSDVPSGRYLGSVDTETTSSTTSTTRHPSISTTKHSGSHKSTSAAPASTTHKPGHRSTTPKPWLRSTTKHPGPPASTTTTRAHSSTSTLIPSPTSTTKKPPTVTLSPVNPYVPSRIGDPANDYFLDNYVAPFVRRREINKIMGIQVDMLNKKFANSSMSVRDIPREDLLDCLDVVATGDWKFDMDWPRQCCLLDVFQVVPYCKFEYKPEKPAWPIPETSTKHMSTTQGPKPSGSSSKKPLEFVPWAGSSSTRAPRRRTRLVRRKKAKNHDKKPEDSGSSTTESTTPQTTGVEE